MSIDTTRHPIALFTDLMVSKNPSFEGITQNDISIRRITDKSEIVYEPTVVYITDRRVIEEHPEVEAAEIVSMRGVDSLWWLVRKWMYFDGNDVTYYVKVDDHARLYIDGVFYAEYRGGTTGTDTISLPAGYHDIMIFIYEGPGFTYFRFHGTDGTNTYVSDDSWVGTSTTQTYDLFDDTLYLERVTDTTVEVDVKGWGSESYGDYVTFSYGRIPIGSLFSELDTVGDKVTAEITYPVAAAGMFTDSINDFGDIYNNWYRFSHKAGFPYPADPEEIDGWTYIAEFDAIESLENSGTYVGFISDDLADDYVFSTVITSDNNDNDAMSIILAAYKQGDVDELEHTLSLINIRGTNNGPHATLRYDYVQSGSKVIASMPIEQLSEGDSGAWKAYYIHVYVRRSGNIMTVYHYYDFLDFTDGETRDETIVRHVSDCGSIPESDLSAAGYVKYVFDLTVVAPIFTGGVRYGYGQLSQANTRFWNIRRPNDNPDVSDALKQYFLDTYNWNVGDSGISVANMSNNVYTVNFDNVVYKGTLTLLPE